MLNNLICYNTRIYSLVRCWTLTLTLSKGLICDNLNIQCCSNCFRPAVLIRWLELTTSGEISKFSIKRNFWRYFGFFNSKVKKGHLRFNSVLFKLKIRPVIMDDSDMWLNVGDNLLMLVTEYRCWWHLLNIAAKRQCPK